MFRRLPRAAWSCGRARRSSPTTRSSASRGRRRRRLRRRHAARGPVPAVRDRTDAVGTWPNGRCDGGRRPQPGRPADGRGRLSAAGVPHVILDGDIADPARLGGRWPRAAWTPATRCTSASPPSTTAPTPGPAEPARGRAPSRGVSRPGRSARSAVPPGAGAYALPDGSAIPASAVALDLAPLFRRWRPLARRHGWLVIEAHAVPAAILAALIGRTHATVLDATHGYACQYPVSRPPSPGRRGRAGSSAAATPSRGRPRWATRS